MSERELERFALECMTTALAYHNEKFEVCDTPQYDDMECDLIIEGDGRTVLGFITYFSDADECRSFIKQIHGPVEDFRSLYPDTWKRFSESDGKVTPIFFIPHFRCLDTEGRENICGCRYEVSFTPYEPLSPSLPTSGDKLSEYELYKGYADSWVTGDTTFMRNHVLMEFRGDSDLSFLQYTSKGWLLSRVEHIYGDGALPHSIYSYKLVCNPETGENGILFYKYGRENAFVTLGFRYGRINRSYTKRVPQGLIPWELPIELNQTQYYHLLPFVDMADAGDLVQEGADTRKFYLFDFPLNLAEKLKGVEYLVLCYGERFRDGKYFDIAYQMLFRSRKGTPEVEFVTMFPNLFGVEVELTILDVIEWDNRLAATVKARYEKDGSQFDFWFFASDYFENRTLYRRGAKWVVDLAASSEKMEAGEAKAGVGGTNESHNPFCGPENERTTVWTEIDRSIPNLIEFQAPVQGEVHSTRFFGRNVNWCEVTINDATGLTIPLYFQGGFTPTPGTPIRGNIWLTGSICESESESD